MLVLYQHHDLVGDFCYIRNVLFPIHNVYQEFNFRKIKNLFLISARFCKIYFIMLLLLSTFNVVFIRMACIVDGLKHVKIQYYCEKTPIYIHVFKTRLQLQITMWVFTRKVINYIFIAFQVFRRLNVLLHTARLTD